MVSVLVVGATRGLGASLTKRYALQSSNKVFGTSRSASTPTDSSKGVTWLHNVDLMKSDVGEKLVTQLESKKPLDFVVRTEPILVECATTLSSSTNDLKFITAGRFTTEDFSKDKGPNWDEQTTMYTTSAIAPVFIVHQLFHKGLIAKGSKVILVSSESGSITLRHESEGGGNYGHHASKAALNMAGKLLSLDMKESGVVVSIVHPGFMRTEMTKGVGFDKFWDEGGGEHFTRRTQCRGLQR